MSTNYKASIHDVKEKYTPLGLFQRRGILEKLWRALVMGIKILVSIFVIITVVKIVYKSCDSGRKKIPQPVLAYELDRVK